MIDSRSTEIEILNKAFAEVVNETDTLAEKVKSLRNIALYLDYEKHHRLRDAYDFLEFAQNMLSLS